MKFDTKQEITLDEDVDLYLVPVFEEGEINSLFQKPDSFDFKGKSGDLFKLYSQKPKRTIYIGLGKQSEATPDTIRKDFGAIAGKIRNEKYTKYAIVFPTSFPLEVDKFTEIVVEGSILGSYKFEKYITSPERKREPINKITLLTGNHDSSLVSKGLEYGKIVADATNFTRDLNNTPHMDMNAIIMAQQAKSMAEAHGLSVKILDREEAQKEDMNLFLSVNNGSKDVVPSQFVVLEYNPADAKKTIVFIGKGITFDTGGISLKSGAGMGDMLYDMCGAGAVIGAMQAIAQIKPKGVKVVGITPLTDNSPSSSATKPGDIIKSKNGKTVQIENTDAEGRLILADALTYAERYNPDFVIDLATLTGACVVALGGIYAASYFNNVDENIKNTLMKSGDYTGDLLWHMPLHKEYFEQIEDKHADIKNTGGRPAGSITAAMFLKEFAEKFPWCHLDIAGTAWGDKEKGYLQKGASGFGTRILVEFIRNISN